MKKLRRTMLFAPASNPKLLFNTAIYKPDCILFDLEDAVRYDEKDAARDLLVEAFKTIDYGKCEVFVRTNPLRKPTGEKAPFGELDIRALVPAGMRRMRLPMCEKPEHIEELAALLDEVEKECGIEPGSVKVQASLETPIGVMNALAIAQSSERITSISFGAEDFTRTLGTDRTKAATELFFARSQVVMAASVAGVDAIDTVWADVSDTEGFIKEVESAKNLGFSGKSCIHPSQVKEVHNIFTPSMEEVEKSVEILKAAAEANIQDGGVITVKGKMVDIPVIAKAERIVSLAKGAGLIK
ncbi:aldolase/citrate lyase family protein [uncultured Ilyobacter sp.]|uniref:HpcH/HpaI aldolase/citrate lyase family protein n=1 Tax=uncultured Ilyobacter sp. TaxID=544433 RepID=UPI0029F563DE|nr:aldolase/citrate lyase family protein [uncultured Ilyobacter sp.]